MKRIVTVNDATGLVVEEWQGGDEQILEPVAGRTRVAVLDDQSYAGMRWLGGTTFVAVVQGPIRVIPYSQFLGRFDQRAVVGTEAEVYERMAGSSDVIQAFNRRGQASGEVNLDAIETMTMLNDIKATGVPTPMWADDAAADLRIAAITADG